MGAIFLHGDWHTSVVAVALALAGSTALAFALLAFGTSAPRSLRLLRLSPPLLGRRLAIALVELVTGMLTARASAIETGLAALGLLPFSWVASPRAP